MSNNIYASFTIDVKEVNKNLIAIARLTGRFSKTTTIQIRVLNRAIELSRQGITKRIEARTEGEADISLPVSLLKGYLTGSLAAYKKFVFCPGELACDASIYSSSAIKVEPVFTNPENVLPGNLNRISVLRYWLNKSEAEIEKSGLTATIEIAKRKMKTNIREALEFLYEYEVKYEDLEELVKRKIKNEC